MGHAIHKHMNSFKASNDLKYNAIDDITQGDGAGDKGSAMKMDQAPTMKKGSMAPQMNESALYHASTGHGKHVSPERSHSDGQGGMYSSHSHDTESQKRKDKALTKKQESKTKS